MNIFSYEEIRALLPNGAFWQWPAMVVVTFVFTFIVKLTLGILSSRLRKIALRTPSQWDDVGVDLIDGLRSWVIFLWFFHILTRSLEVQQNFHKPFLIIVVMASVYQFGIWGLHVIKSWRGVVLQSHVSQDPSSAAALNLLYTLAQGIFIVMIVLIGLSNLGVNISALLAGLGVGGIAVALAAQSVLGDLLASLSIALDKPFVVGDFIVAGADKGTVENIGIRTTRLRSLSGEELVLSNKDLLESRIQNFKRMWRRRVVQKFGVIYATPADVLEKIPFWIKEIIIAESRLTFDRCHFAAYGGSSLDFELVFYVTDPDYNTYMDLQQRILLAIFRKFSLEGVEFAFPTQSIYVEKLPNSAVGFTEKSS